MDFIINPTNACNFNCEFCAASNLPKGKLTLRDTLLLLAPYKRNIGGIIINGGDPLMMDPSYYFGLLKWIEKNTPRSFLSMTTNLFDFYIHPEKWIQLFCNKRVGVMTSFQYGGKRRYRDKDGIDKVYQEDFFKEVEKEFEKQIGYTPGFIYVVDKSNLMYVYKALDLAKELNTMCRLNRVEQCGKNDEYFPYYDILKLYIEIIDNGYGQYEINCKNLYEFFKFHTHVCNINNRCQETITVINPDKTMTTCSYLADNIYRLDREKYDLGISIYNRWSYSREVKYINNQCLYCDNYELCNGCHCIAREVHENNDESNYCYNMKQIIPELKEKILKFGDEFYGK